MKTSITFDILDCFPDAVLIVNKRGVITYANGLAEVLIGSSRQELIGSSVDSLVPVDLRRRHHKQRENFTASPELLPMGKGRELLLLRPDGQERQIEIGLSAIDVDHEKLVVCCLRDVTTLKEREEHLQQVIDAMPGIFYVFNDKYQLTWWNKNVETVLGYTAEELRHMAQPEFIHPDDRAEVFERVRLIFEDGQPRRAEYNLLLKDGTTIPYAGNGALCELEGKPNMVGLGVDVSQLRETEAQLRARITEVEELKSRLEFENAYLRQEVDLIHRHPDIVGESPAIRSALQQIEKVAATESTVLLLGETGTGKELMARRVHDLGPRKDRSMVTVNCAALPATLMEAELFGREKGAYTGAISRESGRFEIADKSTLFLDEIGELPLELQSKLLRVLEEGEFERLGSPRTRKVDVRIIAATNKDLAEAVHEGRFRKDLFYRLNVFPILVPPLRDRHGDLPLLVWSFIEEFSRIMGVTIESVSQNSMERLQRHSWPGNVRELRNIVERSMIVNSGPALRLVAPAADEAPVGVALTLDEVQRRHIQQVVEMVDGRISGPDGAAKILGIKPTTLRSRMERLKI